MTLSQIKARVRYLQRKYAEPLKVIRARRVADEVTEQWGVARANHTPLPDPEEVLDRVREARIRGSFMGLMRYIRSCLDEGSIPEALGFLQSLLPRADSAGLVRAALRWDPPARDRREYRPRPYTEAVFPFLE